MFVLRSPIQISCGRECVSGTVVGSVSLGLDIIHKDCLNLSS